MVTARTCGLLSLAGLSAFFVALGVLHVANASVDMVDQYISNLANARLGWAFGAGTLVHGLGNLALAWGLFRTLPASVLRNAAVTLFGLAIAGVMIAAVFPTDPPGQPPTLSGDIHRTAASTGFALELAALFVFSAVFRHARQWQPVAGVSLGLAVSGAIAVTLFVIAVQLDRMPGLAERIALGIFMSWEGWASIRLLLAGHARRTARWP